MITFTYYKKEKYIVKIEDIGIFYNSILFEQQFDDIYSAMKYNPLNICKDNVHVIYDISVNMPTNKYLNFL